MLVPLSWLKEYVEVTLSLEELVARLTLAGLEVAGIERIGETWSREHVFVGQVLEVQPHPNADRLTLPLVDYGRPQPLRVVTGAPNIHVGDRGQKVVLALAGARLIDGHSEEVRYVTLKPSKIRGVASEGMVCSEKELGLSDEHEGILILPDDAPVGMPLQDYLGDVVLDIEVTPNMARCLSIIGIAREVAALTGQKLRLGEPEMEACGEPASTQAEVEIADPDLCSRYCAAVIKGIKVGPSPFWMQRRLSLCGVRPINNIVDITNYVMLEWGQPLHAFDYNLLHGRGGQTPPAEKPLIRVRRAEAGERMVTLDGQERVLDRDILLITDGSGPVAVAGVMGGLHSEITDETRDVLLEAAAFDMLGNRISSARLKLASEASSRFGKGVPPSLAPRAARRAAELMRQLAGGQVQQGLIDNYPRPQPSVVVKMQPERARKVLGLDIGDDDMERILTSLEFAVRRDGDSWSVQVPDHRLDVSIEEDLYEEIARVHGYDRLPATLLRDELPPQHDDSSLRGEELVRNVLAALGLQEAISYSLGDWRLEEPLLPQEGLGTGDFVRVINPLSADRQWLRRSLLPRLLLAARDNFHNDDVVRLFEIGRVFLPVEGSELPEEPLRLAILIAGLREQPSWLVPQPESVDFFDGKGVLDELSRRLGLGLSLRAEPHRGLHPARSATVLLDGREPVGFYGELHPQLRSAYDLPDCRICVGEFDMAALIAAWVEHPQARPVSRFPAVLQDMALIVPDEVTEEQVERGIWRAGKGVLASVTLFDLYQGPPVPAGFRSLAFRLAYQLQDRLLSDEEVKQAHSRIARSLASELGARLRE